MKHWVIKAKHPETKVSMFLSPRGGWVSAVRMGDAKRFESQKDASSHIRMNDVMEQPLFGFQIHVVETAS